MASYDRNDLFPPALVRKAKQIMDATPAHKQAAALDEQIIAAEMPRINKLTHQENSSRYCAYMLQYLISSGKL